MCCVVPVGINMGLLNIVLFAALFAVAIATVAVITPCKESSVDICQITEARITPCKKPQACVLKKKTNVTMSFDFTPNFVSTQLSTNLYWDNNGLDVAFEGFGSDDACSYTPCPTEAGKSQTLSYELYIDKLLPSGTFPIKWKLWNKEKDSELCCFATTIKLKK